MRAQPTEDRRHRHRNRRAHRRPPARSRARADRVRGRRPDRRPHQHDPGRRPARATSGWTPASSSTTTATTRSSRGLLAELGVETQPAEMGMSIAIGRRALRVRQHPARAVRAALEPAAAAVLAPDRRPASLQPRGAPARRAAPTPRRSASSCATPATRAGSSSARSLPEVSAVWSADPPAIWDFPLGFLAEFLDNHGQLQLTGRPRWRTIAGGSRAYVERLVAPFATGSGSAPRCARIERLGRRRRDRGRRLRDRALRRGRDRLPLRPGAGDARRPHRPPSARSSARCATSPTRPSCTPTPR